MNKGPALTDLNVVPHMDLHEIPKKFQYITVDSNFINGTNNTFSLDLTLESNTHVEDMSRVLGIRMVDFYITQVGASGQSVPKYVDIVCPDIPKTAQILDERNGQILARIPLERHFTATSTTILRDKQWRRFQQNTNYFNPMSIKKLNFKIYEEQDDGDYVTLNPDSKWYMILEIATVNVKEKPRDKEQQMLQLLQKLLVKMDSLNQNIRRLPDNPSEEPKKKYPFGLLLCVLVTIFGGFIWSVNRSTPSPQIIQ
jgi:hypothetical protein